MDSYLREVAFHLRRRGASEAEVSARLAELAAVPNPQSTFGDSRQAADVPLAESRRSTGWWIMQAGVLLAVVWMAWFIIGQTQSGEPVTIASFLLPPLVLLGLAAVGMWWDYRKPKPITATRQSRP